MDASQTSNDKIFLVGGNWKMNGSLKDITTLVGGLNTITPPANVQVVIAPSDPYLVTVNLLKADYLELSGQNCDEKKSGARTGESSPDMLTDVGCKWVILGHSERRHVFGESQDRITAKVSSALDSGLDIIYCIGEKLEERESNATESILKAQLDPIADILVAHSSRIVIAYEPVWAIGTGKAATPEIAQTTHANIRSWLAGKKCEKVRILYGGSVKPSNCESLATQSDIDGFLVGGASLKSNLFGPIIQSGSKSS